MSSDEAVLRKRLEGMVPTTERRQNVPDWKRRLCREFSLKGVYRADIAKATELTVSQVCHAIDRWRDPGDEPKNGGS